VSKTTVAPKPTEAKRPGLTRRELDKRLTDIKAALYRLGAVKEKCGEAWESWSSSSTLAQGWRDAARG
jgi:hypothetical protein